MKKYEVMFIVKPTLSEEEVMNSFNKIIEEVEKTGAKLRNK